MKRMICMGIGTLLIVTSITSAQSLGDYARNARKNKPQTSTQSRYFDNDNLPTNEQLSVVGPAPSANPPASSASAAANKAAADAESQKANAELQSKIDDQKSKLDSLNRELDLEQREYRLRAAAFYGDAGDRLRNAAQWDKDNTQYKSDIESKEKAIATAKEQLDQLQEDARKSGMKQKESDNQGDKDKDQGKDKDQDKNK